MVSSKEGVFCFCSVLLRAVKIREKTRMMGRYVAGFKQEILCIFMVPPTRCFRDSRAKRQLFKTEAFPPPHFSAFMFHILFVHVDAWLLLKPLLWDVMFRQRWHILVATAWFYFHLGGAYEGASHHIVTIIAWAFLNVSHEQIRFALRLSNSMLM